MTNAITRHQFVTLHVTFQSILLQLHGIDLEASYDQALYKVKLFKLYDFYMALWYNRETGKLEKMTTFSSYKRLDPFLPAVDISPLMMLLQE